MKLLVVLGTVVLVVSFLLSSFLSLKYPPATFVDLSQRLTDLGFNYAQSAFKLLDFVGIAHLPVFYRWFFGRKLPHSIEPTEIAGVSVTIFKPPAYSSKKLLPGIIHVAGGSFLLPPQKAHFDFCSMLATNVTAIVFLIHPHLAPEHPFPETLNDVRAVANYILRQPEKFGVRPSRIAIGGDDTGASLALSVVIELANGDPNKQSLPPNMFYTHYMMSPILQVANLLLPSYVESKPYLRGINPAVALSYYSGVEHPSSDTVEAISGNLHIPFTLKIRFQPLIDFNMLNDSFIPEGYVAPDLALDLSPVVPESITWVASNPEAFPMLYDNSYLNKLPVTYIQVCEHSVARDDGLIFAKRLEQAAVSLKLAVIRQTMHNDPVMRSSIFVQATRDLIRFLRRTLYKQKE